jgi:hypothetical protein
MTLPAVGVYNTDVLFVSAFNDFTQGFTNVTAG